MSAAAAWFVGSGVNLLIAALNGTLAVWYYRRGSHWGISAAGLVIGLAAAALCFLSGVQAA